MKFLTIIFICLTGLAQAQMNLCYYGDTLWGPIDRIVEYRQESDYIIKTVYTHNSSENTTTACFYDPQNKQMGKWQVKYNDRGSVVETGLYCKDETPCQKCNYSYNANDRTSGKRFVHYSNNSHSLSSSCNRLLDLLDGSISSRFAGVDSFVTISTYQYDTPRRLQFQQEKFVTIRPTYIDTTVELTNYAYENSGSDLWLVEKKEIRIRSDGSDTTDEATVYRYDERRNLVEKIVLKSTSGNRAVDSTRTLFRYNDQNSVIESRSYYQAKHTPSKPGRGKQVGAGSEYSYDNAGNLTSHTFYSIYRLDDGSERKDGVDTQKVAKEETEKEYDARGNIIKITSRGSKILTREIWYY